MPPQASFTSRFALFSGLKSIETVLSAVLVATVLPCSIVYLTTKSSILSLTSVGHHSDEQGHLVDPEGQSVGSQEMGDWYALHILFVIERSYRRCFWGKVTKHEGGEKGEVKDYVWSPRDEAARE